MFPTWLLVVTLQFTAPVRAAIPGSCDEGPHPITDLRWGYVRGLSAGGDTLELLRLPLAGMEGQRVTFDLNLSGPWTIWVVTEDWSGNVSCLSNPLAVNLPPSVAVSALQPPAGEKWYDIVGRRVDKPTRSGVYFVQRGPQQRRKIAIIR